LDFRFLSPMRHSFTIISRAALLATLLPALTFAQGKVEGTVSDGTSGKPVARQQVRLLMPRN
jgi:hypothetical protein